MGFRVFLGFGSSVWSKTGFIRQGDLGLGVGFRVQGLGFSGLVVGVQPSGIVQGNQAKS